MALSYAAMHILALNPFHGGSHKAFLDGWVANSNRHDWTCLTLPDRHWKWRMRHGAFTFAQQLREQPPERPVDLIFTTDMMDVAALRGLLPASYRDVPILCYFHENQLTYPWQDERERDHHFAYTNIQSALAADAVWFNSKFHRDNFFDAAEVLLRRMPDFAPINALLRTREAAGVQYPGIDSISNRAKKTDSNASDFHICWAARREHDKNPEDFFDALRQIRALGVPFQLSVLGQQYEKSPPCFDEARQTFKDETRRWGYLPRAEYLDALAASDCFVSTANHEFFGISTIEAMNAGCIPLLPDRLAYPEILQTDSVLSEACIYDGSVEDLVSRLRQLASQRVAQSKRTRALRDRAIGLASRFHWVKRATEMDEAAEVLLTTMRRRCSKTW